MSSLLALLVALVMVSMLTCTFCCSTADVLLHQGMLHFWLSRGRGTTGLCDTSSPTFYALLTSETSYLEIDRDNGYRAVTTPVEPKPMYFTVMQNTNCLQGSVAKLEAMSKGADLVSFQRHQRMCFAKHAA